MGTQLDITVGGRWLALDCSYGEITMSKVWPGGSDELSWTMGSQSAHRFTGGEPVCAYFGGALMFGGTLLEPDPTQDQMVAQGSWRLGDDFLALDGSGNATNVPDTAIDQAISRGLKWTRPNSISSSAASVDVSQGPVTVGSLLDSWAQENNQRWGVDSFGNVYARSDDTSPTYQTFPLESGLGYALDNYASTLVGRYYNGTSYATNTATDSTAEALHGHREIALDLTPRGTITATKANQILSNLLTQGVSTPAWTVPIEFSYGEILTTGGTPIALEAVKPGRLLRVHGGTDLPWRTSSGLYVDVPIGRTELSDGTLTVTAAVNAGRSFTDALTAALSKK